MPSYDAACENSSCPKEGEKVSFFSRRFLSIEGKTGRYIDKECGECRQSMLKRVFGVVPSLKMKAKGGKSKERFGGFASQEDMLQAGKEALLHLHTGGDPKKRPDLFAPSFKREVKISPEVFGGDNLN
jgi:hypothetical protein